MITLSIVICTYNRATILAETLSSFAKLGESRDNRIELIVVDNKSTDTTAMIVSDINSEISCLKYIYEPEPGLSYARNRGIRESRGNIIAFADDDVLFGHGWGYTIIDIFENTPTAFALGGKSTPVFDGGKPAWIEDRFQKMYGDTLLGDEFCEITYPQHPFGLNMAFRREVFNKIGYFNTELGRKKTNLLSNEESEFFSRMAQHSLKVVYEPTALLYHRIPRERASSRWLRNRKYWQGISDVIQDEKNKTKIEHTKKFIVTIKEILKFAFGQKLTPRKAYWRFKSLTEADWIQIHYLAGVAVQSLRTCLRFSTKKY